MRRSFNEERRFAFLVSFTSAFWPKVAGKRFLDNARVRQFVDVMSYEPAKVILRNLAIGDAGWLIQRHAELYARDEGFDASFEALVAEILADYIRTHDPACERAFIATSGEKRLGSIFCTRGGAPEVARLRMFWVEPEARGLGLGQKLLDACLNYARETGYRKLWLWTHESHRAACALYERNGFKCTASKAEHSFGVDVVEQTWEIDLA